MRASVLVAARDAQARRDEPVCASVAGSVGLGTVEGGRKCTTSETVLDAAAVAS